MSYIACWFFFRCISIWYNYNKYTVCLYDYIHNYKISIFKPSMYLLIDNYAAHKLFGASTVVCVLWSVRDAGTRWQQRSSRCSWHAPTVSCVASCPEPPSGVWRLSCSETWRVPPPCVYFGLEITLNYFFGKTEENRKMYFVYNMISRVGLIRWEVNRYNLGKIKRDMFLFVASLGRRTGIVF